MQLDASVHTVAGADVRRVPAVDVKRVLQGMSHEEFCAIAKALVEDEGLLADSVSSLNTEQILAAFEASSGSAVKDHHIDGVLGLNSDQSRKAAIVNSNINDDTRRQVKEFVRVTPH
eukprot:TRINITY_DN7872_c1_g1_i2.p1 TRINITY_DN7872_c1_g1~~TRINITY_DN7872_c1_g1_i2.p1  ORF type:complete len:117 (+),score=27.09 TRINITY_DN7872_c1_g1_i2:44-394(+)